MEEKHPYHDLAVQHLLTRVAERQAQEPIPIDETSGWQYFREGCRIDNLREEFGDEMIARICILTCDQDIRDEVMEIFRTGKVPVAEK